MGVLVRLASVLLLGLIRLLKASCRYQIHGAENLPTPPDERNGGFVMAFWHQNLVAAILAESGRRNFTTMASRSRDGDVVSYVLVWLGHQPARGSSAKGARDKGGRQARDRIVELLVAGYPGGVTVDGPTGPLYEVKPGVITMAQRAQVPIIPYYVAATRYWSLPSWDRLRIPLPFSTIHVHYGAPIAVPADLAGEEFAGYQARIKSVLDEFEQRENPQQRPGSPRQTGSRC